VVSDEFAALTTIVVGHHAPAKRVAALARRVNVVRAPLRGGRVDLRRLLTRLGRENVTSLLAEGGGEVNASFLLGGFAHRVAFFYAPKILAAATPAKPWPAMAQQVSKKSFHCETSNGGELDRT
jgi:diaminohydroxyphosphoribosylaminopyrimidine deaminase/5-amino-6-(5-phosphoribosylamino)uracil reductase